MKQKTKLLAFLIVIIIAMLACSTITNSGGNASSGQGNVLFEDDFSRTGSGWDRQEYDVGLTDYLDGAYVIRISSDHQLFWANPYENFDDVIIEVEAQKTEGGDDMQYGIICRHVDIENWYALIVTADGFAAIRKLYNGGDLNFITDFVEVPSMNTGNATNQLRAECVGDHLALYVNGELAVDTHDSDLTSGDVGLMAGTFDQPSAEVLFDNFVVRKP